MEFISHSIQNLTVKWLEFGERFVIYGMKQEFKIYKEGTTTEMITILSKVGEPFNREDKIQKYLSLGYKVYNLQNEEIK